VPVENLEERLRPVQAVGRDRHHVVVHVPAGVLVEIVADAGRVLQEVLDRDGVVDQRQVRAEVPAGRVAQTHGAGLDESQHGQGGERLAPAGDAEPGLHRVRNAMGAVGVAVGPLEDAAVRDVDGDDAAEADPCGRLVERVLVDRCVVGHGRSLVERGDGWCPTSLSLTALSLTALSLTALSLTALSLTAPR
jgi:hypothetical protein